MKAPSRQRLALLATAAAVALVAGTQLTAGAAIVPDPPTDVTATPGDASASVSFTAPLNGGDSPISQYTATCTSGDAGAATGQNTGTSSPIAVTGLTNGKTYTCTVTAENATGPSSPSGASNSFVPVAPATVPDAPTIGTATAGDAGASVGFTAGADGGAPILDFTATCTSGDGGATGQNTGTSSPITVTGLTNGKTYTCTVTARNALGSSPASGASNSFVPVAPATVPNAPTIGTATAGNASASVGFTAGADGGAPILDFTATCTSGDGGATGQATGSGAPITVTGLTNGKTYTCTVTARNAVGSSPASGASNSFVPATVPSSPSGVNATASDVRQLSVGFTPGADGGAPILDFTATCTSNDGGATGQGTGGGAPITVSGLTNGTTYTCTVTARNALGSSPASAASPAVKVWDVPSAPRSVGASPADRAATVDFSPPADTGGTPIIDYTATCTSSDGGATGSKVGALPPLAVTGLTNGKTYRCTVTARNAVGTSSPSGASNSFVPATLPGPPLIGTASRGNASATVSFQAPADDGGAAILDYTATCVSSNGGATGQATGGGAPITVTGLTNGKTYTCTVTARNVNGSGLVSEHTNAFVPATIPGAPANVTATPSDSSAIVTWTAPDDGGSPITVYTVVASPGGATAQVGGSARSATVTGLHNGVAYTFTVRATNDVGAGPTSAESDAVIPNLLDIEGKVIAATANGYWFVTADGKVAAFGDAKNYGGVTGPLNAFIVGLEPTPTMKGYWLIGVDGGIFSFGNAKFHGSTGNIRLNRPIVGMASTPSGEGYWLVASDGGVFAFGDAVFHGSTGAIALNRPIVGMTATPTGNGYWLVATDGGIFAFGDAVFFGSTGAIHLNQPIVGMDRTASGRGYWLVASDGGVFAFGAAPFYGSTGAIRLNAPIIGMAATPTGKGYWFVAGDAGLFSFGDAPFYGPPLGGHEFFRTHPVTGMSASRASG